MWTLSRNRVGLLPPAITHLYGVFPTLYALLIVTFSQELLCHAGSNAFLSQLTRTLANTVCDSEYLHTAHIGQCSDLLRCRGHMSDMSAPGGDSDQ